MCPSGSLLKGCGPVHTHAVAVESLLVHLGGKEDARSTPGQYRVPPHFTNLLWEFMTALWPGRFSGPRGPFCSYTLFRAPHLSSPLGNSP